MDAVRTFVGRGQFTDWRFTLAPEANEAGSHGYRRSTLTPSRCSVDSVRASGEYYERFVPGYTAQHLASLVREDWIEERWLTEWLRLGHVAEVKT